MSYLKPGDRSVTLHNGSAVFAMSCDDAADGRKDRRHGGFGRHGEEDEMKWLGPGWKWRIYMLNWGPATCKRTTFLRRSVAGKTDEPEVDPKDSRFYRSFRKNGHMAFGGRTGCRLRIV